jgi:predicted dienelactone hydrolase
MGFLFGRRTVIPPPSGAHAIGTTRFDLTGSRKIPVQAWYPAQPSDGPREMYLDDELRAALAEMTRVPKFLLPQNPSYSVVNAPAVPSRYPVLVFNHGFGSFQKQSTSLMEELASHGYVVLSVGHPSESLVVQFADGTVQRHRADHPAWVEIRAGLKDLEKNIREVEPLLARARAAKDPATLREAMIAIAAHRSYAALVPVLEFWRQDTSLVLDQLGSLPAPLGAIVDPAQVGVFGHSLGGMVSGQLAMTDARVRAGMNFDGAQLPLSGEGPYALRVPFCFLYAGTSKVGATSVSTGGMNDALLTAGGCGATLRGATHLNFTDMNNLSMMARALGSIDRAEMARVLRAATVGFFDHHLKGRPLSGFTPSECLEVTTLKPEGPPG